MHALDEIQLPSNKNFGYFFTFLFAIVAVYFYYSKSIFWANLFVAISSIFLLIVVIKSDILLPLNKLWMRFGFLLGAIVSPIILGIIFFGIFTPFAMIMRLFGRDELNLKFNQKQSHWISRKESSVKTESFKYQF